MNPISYFRATNREDAVDTAALPSSRYLAGGTNLIDLMRVGVEQPAQLVDITALPLTGIEDLPDGGLRIGALARNSDAAADERVRNRYPVLARAILSGASPQVRNMATIGGNLLQRTRCGYFYDTAASCNRRTPGMGCDAVDGLNRMHAILGASDSCIAVHPSDMCVALAALDATVQIERQSGMRRSIPATELHRLPGDTPHVETALEPGDLVTSVDLPPASPGRTTYVKVRDRASFAFALVSLAVLLDCTASRVDDARIALGGVAAKPWRATAAERVLHGAEPGPATFRRAAEATVADARPYRHNGFKVELVERLVNRTLSELAFPREVQRS